MRKEEILRLIKETIAKTMLSGAKVILFGPQARGDAREDSDWDILILLLSSTYKCNFLGADNKQ